MVDAAEEEVSLIRIGLVSSPSEKMFDEDGDRTGGYGDFGSTILKSKACGCASKVVEASLVTHAGFFSSGLSLLTDGR